MEFLFNYLLMFIVGLMLLILYKNIKDFYIIAILINFLIFEGIYLEDLLQKEYVVNIMLLYYNIGLFIATFIGFLIILSHKKRILRKKKQIYIELIFFAKKVPINIIILIIFLGVIYSIIGYYYISITNDILAYRKLLSLSGLGLGYINNFIIYSLYLSFFVLLLKYVWKKTCRYFFYIFLLFDLLIFPSGSNTFIGFLFIILLIWSYLYKPHCLKRYYILSLLLILIVGYNYLMRWHTTSDISLKEIIEIVLNRIFENNIHIFLENFSYNFWYGKSFLYLILQPIPRFIYPEKPYLVDTYLTNLFNINWANLQFGPIVEGFLNFGLYGCFIWGFLNGFFIIVFILFRYLSMLGFIYTTLVFITTSFDFGIDRYYMIMLLYSYIIILFWFIIIKSWRIN